MRSIRSKIPYPDLRTLLGSSTITIPAQSGIMEVQPKDRRGKPSRRSKKIHGRIALRCKQFRHLSLGTVMPHHAEFKIASIKVQRPFQGKVDFFVSYNSITHEHQYWCIVDIDKRNSDNSITKIKETFIADKDAFDRVSAWAFTTKMEEAVKSQRLASTLTHQAIELT